MTRNEKLEREQANARRLVFEMIEAAMDLAARKGPHPLEKDCNCIACINRRKDLDRGNPPPWKHFL